MRSMVPLSLRWSELLRTVGVAAGVFAIGWATIAFTRLTTQVPVLWPTNGLVLGACLMASARSARHTMAAAFVGNALASWAVREDLGMSLGLPLANLLETGSAWWALRAIVARHPNLGHPQVLWRFTVFAVLLAPALSGAVATAVLMNAPDSRWAVFVGWWASDALGMALFAPLAVTFRPAEWKAYWTRARLVPLLAPLVGLIAVSMLVFSQNRYPLLFFVFPPLIWLVFRWGFAGAAVGGLALVLVSFPLTYLGLGPMMLLADHSVGQRFFLLQVFMGTALLSALPVGMILDHRNQLLARLRRREVELEHLAMHDALSGLLNRRGLSVALDNELGLAQQAGRALSVVVLDVDMFKNYNDTYGHPRGDECLAWLGTEIRRAAERADGVGGRQGGEEFAAVLPGLTAAAALAWAERLRARVEAADREHRGSPLGRVTVSLGVAGWDPSGRTLPDGAALIEAADAALYQAKRAGRNQVALAASPGR